MTPFRYMTIAALCHSLRRDNYKGQNRKQWKKELLGMLKDNGVTEKEIAWIYNPRETRNLSSR